jgi:hypothetical protein
MGNNSGGMNRMGNVSTFMVHLTRNTEDARSAKENLIDILCTRVIQPRNSKGLFYATEGVSDAARTVCFSEAQFNAIKHLVGKHQGRGVELSPYGLVFSKDFLIAKGANPVFYVNTYAHQARKQAIFEAIKQLDIHKQKEIAPFVEIFGWNGSGGIYDFHREHEWRYPGDFEFEWKDIIFGLCDDDHIEEMELLFEKEIKFISPYMNLEEIFGRMVLNWEEARYGSYREHFETT